MTRLLLAIVLALCAVVVAPAQEPAPPAERPELRPFDEQQVSALRADMDYDQDLRQAPTVWDRFKEWLFGWLERILGTKAGSFVVDNLLYLIAIVTLIAAVVILSRNGLRSVFHGAPRSAGQVLAVEEDIRELDLPALIQQAEAAGDLRRAIRLHYLLVLRRLVDQGALEWSPDRTDRDYIRQLHDPALRARFANAALIFQWVWYGHAEVDRERYESIRRPFVQFEQSPVR